MSEFFIGQVMMAGFGFAPKFFGQCNGQLLPIAQNQALFSLLGTQYGGNGQTTFALPDLRSRTPIGYASSVDASWQPPSVQIGQVGGVEIVTLLGFNLPTHVHAANATAANGTTRNPNAAIFATTPVSLHGSSSGPAVALNAATVAPVGSNQPHSNMQPYTTVNFCIALQGIFPSRN